MTQSKKIILLTTSLILTICLMAFFGVYALTIAKNSTFNVGVKYEPEYLVKVEMWIDGANGGTEDKIIDDKEYVEIFNSSTPVSNGMYIQSMSNDTIHINSQTLKPIGENGEVHFKITSLENEISGKDLKCVIDCGSSTVDSGKLPFNKSKELIISTGLDSSTNVTPTSSSLGMIKINLKFSEFVVDFVDLKNLVDNLVYDDNSLNELDFGEAGTIKHSDITGKTFYVSNVDGLLNLSALVGKVNTETNEYGLNEDGSKYGYNNSKGSAVTFKGATIQMLNDIDCGNKDNFSKKFIPIGNEINSFQGTFDGNDKTITGLYINQTTQHAGLFGRVLNAEIKDLTMQNCKIVSTSNYTGNFVANADGVIISNCSAEETKVSGNEYVGGIVGKCSSGTITNCYNTGSVGGGGAGGIVGYVAGTTTITNCYNTGSVGGSSDSCGGIVGIVYDDVTITNCYNTGSVSGDSYVGGIAGETYGTPTITNCYNTGSVSAAWARAGGIVGFVNSGTLTITNCYNTGIVSGDVRVGGIVGQASGTATTITNCYNTGSVGDDGGIAGFVSAGTATITNCYYLESISSKAIGEGTAEPGSYYGKFGEDQEVVSEDIEYGSLPAELGSSLNLIDLLNAWVNINKETNPNLKNWQEDKENINNGYPLFVKE